MAKGYKVVCPRREGETSAIVACTHEKHSPGNLYRQLAAKNIMTAPRMGRLRISPHFYNTREEVDELIETLPD